MGRDEIILKVAGSESCVRARANRAPFMFNTGDEQLIYVLAQGRTVLPPVLGVGAGWVGPSRHGCPGSNSTGKIRRWCQQCIAVESCRAGR